MLSSILSQFIEQSPLSIMGQSLMLHMFTPERMDQLFERAAEHQQQYLLLFSAQVDLMSLVVCGIYPSVHAAYRAKAKALGVSTTTVYNKLQGIEPQVSQCLVRETAKDLQTFIQEYVGVPTPSLIPEYPLRIIDGTCLAATDHRPKAIRGYGAKALPGKALVVLEPQTRLVCDVFPCEDGHRQERALFSEVLKRVEAQQVWVADRNFCTAEMLTSLHHQRAFFVMRQHGSLGWTPLSELQPKGKTATGQLFEQSVEIQFQGTAVACRRLVLKLFQPTRNKEWELAILSNLPMAVATAPQIAHVYQNRWRIETLFQTITKNFEGEIHTLAYPKAALFSYSMALMTYNILATLKATLAAEYSWDKIEAGLSDFYLVNEIQGTYRGMMIAVPAEDWQQISGYSPAQLATFLRQLAGQVNLKQFSKTPRGVKKKRPPLIVDPKHRHLSTARKLQAYCGQ